MRLAILLCLNAWIINSSSSWLSSTSRICSDFAISLPPVGKREEERRADLELPLPPDAPAMPLDDAVYGREAHAVPFEFIRRMQALEDIEQFAGVLHVEARAIVLHIEDSAAFGILDAAFDLCLGPFGGEFPCITQEILQHHADQGVIAGGIHRRCDTHFDIAVGICRTELGDDVLSHFRYIDGLFVEQAARQA